MKKLIIALGLVLSLAVVPACVTAEDFRQLAAIQNESFQDIAETLDANQERVTEILEDRDMTSDEKLTAVEEAQEAVLDRLKDIGGATTDNFAELFETIKDRNATIVEAVGDIGSNPTNILYLLLTGILGAGAGAVGGVPLASRKINKERDERRARRSEPV